MEKLTEMLSEEHKNILRMIEILLDKCSAVESGEELDKDFFNKIIDFIQNYADRFHHAKEEDILFRELCKDDVQMHCNPIEQMLYEHNLGREFVKGMVAGLRNNDKKTIIKNAKDYSHLLEEHIMKEDNILYPMAEEVLNNNVKRSIMKKFKEIELKNLSDINHNLSILD